MNTADSLEQIAAREAFQQQQHALRKRLTQNLELIAQERDKLKAEARALEIRVGKIEQEMFTTTRNGERWWHLLSELNVARKREIQIPKDIDALRELAASLGPLVRQAGKDVPRFKESILDA